jgi:transposase InsO family protein
MIVAMKQRHMKWGHRKIIAYLRNLSPDKVWPSESTVFEILKRNSLVRERKIRRRTTPYSEPFIGCGQPNDVWSADYKGQFRMGNGKLCYPLTITDNYSRYLLGCRGLDHPTHQESKPEFERVFCEKGLPKAIKTDNGAPFASVGLGGLSRLSVWFIKLGIRPERIERGKPEQNGRHERMHRTLKESAISPPRSNLAEQQRAFDRFTHEYNCERPHQALGQKTPASIYTPSLKPYPAEMPPVKYDSDVIVRQVRSKGEIKWKGDRVYVSEALVGEPIGLKEIGNYLWEVRFSFHPLGILDEKTERIVPI